MPVRRRPDRGGRWQIDFRVRGTRYRELLARAIAEWRKHLAPATINRRLDVARGLWTMAHDLWGIAMPLMPWSRLRMQEPDRLPVYIPPDVREAIMAVAAPHVRLAMRIALATGWRRASVLGLRWEHVDWDRELIHGWGKGRAGGKALIHPLTTELKAILIEAGVCGAGPIITIYGKPIGDIKFAFDSARRAAGYPQVRFKDLRSTVAQEVLAVTGSLDITGAVLAHNQISTTRKHYARVQLEQVRKALEARSGASVWAPEWAPGKNIEASSRDRTGQRQSAPLNPAPQEPKESAGFEVIEGGSKRVNTA